MEKKKYVAPSMEMMVFEQESLLAANSEIIVPSGPGTSTDHGSGAARPLGSFSVWDDEDSESED